MFFCCCIRRCAEDGSWSTVRSLINFDSSCLLTTKNELGLDHIERASWVEAPFLNGLLMATRIFLLLMCPTRLAFLPLRSVHLKLKKRATSVVSFSFSNQILRTEKCVWCDRPLMNPYRICIEQSPKSDVASSVSHSGMNCTHTTFILCLSSTDLCFAPPFYQASKIQQKKLFTVLLKKESYLYVLWPQGE